MTGYQRMVEGTLAEVGLGMSFIEGLTRGG